MRAGRTVALLAAGLILLAPEIAAGQQPGGEPGAGLPPVTPGRDDGREGGYVVSTERERWREFRLGPVASALAWEEEAGYDDGLLGGLAIERDVASFLALRAGFGYGTTEVEGPGGEVAGVDTRIYLPEVTAVVQLAWGPFERSAVVPYGLIGFGSLISDPDRDGFSTRSQNAFGFGAGARLRLGPRLGARAELERYLMKLEDVFDASGRDSRSVHTTRFGGSLTYAF